jgi:hypothetical protein
MPALKVEAVATVKPADVASVFAPRLIVPV